MKVERCSAVSNYEQDDALNKNLFKYKMTWDNVRLKYNATRELANLKNQVLGWNYGLYFAISILFNSISLDEVFIHKTS